MSQLEYYGTDPVDHLPHKSGLFGWGIALIVGGGLAGLMALIAAAFGALVATGVLPNTTGQKPAFLFQGVVVYVLVAVVMIWLGIGSMKGRRWVRPLMIVGSVLIALSSVFALVPLVQGAIWMLKNPSIKTPTPGVPPHIEVMSLACGGIFMFLLADVLPLITLWFYGRTSVQNTLNLMDIVPRWTDRCPLPVLGWVIGCALLGLGLFFTLLKRVFPFYTIIIVGMPGMILPVVLAITLVAAAFLCYQQRPLGWVITTLVVLVLAGSYLTFAILGDHHQYFSMMTEGMPDQTRNIAERMASGALITPAGMYACAVVYSLWLWKYFKPRS